MKLQFPDLSIEQCHVLFNIAFEDYTVYDAEMPPEPQIQADRLHLTLLTSKYQLIVKQTGEVFGGLDRTEKANEYSPCRIPGFKVRKLLRQYNVQLDTEAEFIKYVSTQHNYDQSPADDFFGTYLLGAYHYVTIFRKTDQEPYTYILHGESHSPRREFCRTTDFDKFLEALDRVNALTLDEQEQLFSESAQIEPKSTDPATTVKLNSAYHAIKVGISHYYLQLPDHVLHINRNYPLINHLDRNFLQENREEGPYTEISLTQFEEVVNEVLDKLFHPPTSTLPKHPEASKQTILAVMEKLKSAIPIEWDRYTKTEDGFYVVFGWIARSDGQRDYVQFQLWDFQQPEEAFFSTSSAKYSRQIMEVLQGTSDDHNDCRKINELLEANL